ncbi:MAG TPA: ABC transporter permease [Vicinamibacterales bacterium]|nr:ABC transporter permease [Vicinamibacterales bacterium]
MVWNDLRFAVRGLLKRPGFTAVAVATLALGIGANTAIFSIVYAVLLRPLPYADVARLARIRGGSLQTHQPGNLSPMDFLDLQARTARFERIAAYNNYADATLTGGGEPERVAGTRVTADFFSVLHVTPLAGRDFTRDDDQPGALPVAILSYGFWTRRFAGDRSVVGRAVDLNSVKTTIVAVLPASFRHPFPENARQPDVYVPFKLDRKENNRGGHYLQAIGLLKPGASFTDGQADLASIAADLARDYPVSNTGRTVTLERMLDSMVGDTRTALLVLMGAVAFVLLIACGNLANLLLARSESRRKEIAVRQALGASRLQLLRQLLIESVALAVAGGACGLLVASAAVRVVSALGADRIPRGDTITIDAAVMTFAFAVAVATGLVFGVGPALHAAAGDAHDALSGRSGGGQIHQRTQQTLVACEIAMTLMLLVCAGLLLKSFVRMQDVDPGFHADRVLTLRTSLPIARYPEGDEIPFYQQVEQRLSSLPGVSRVGAINILPLSDNYSCDSFEIEGRPPFPPQQGPCAESRSVTPGYFDALGIPLLRGRAFTAHDTEQSPKVVIISDDMAKRLWPDSNPVGARIRYQQVPRTIVGVAAGVKHFGLDRDAPFELYTPHAQQTSYHTMTIALRTSADAAALMPLVQRELWAIDRDIPITDVKTMEQVVADSTREPRLRTLLVGAFAALAVLLSVVGVFGVIAYAVTRRTHEIGVRVALGATRRQVVTMMVARGFVPAMIGVAGGIAGALAITRVLSGLLFGVATTDVSVFVGATAVLTSAALVATYLPARRATGIDPTIALRAE